MANNEEIDLKETLIAIFKFIKKNIIILCIAIVLGLLFGKIHNSFKPTVYTNSIIVNSSFQQFQIINLINNFQEMILENNTELLSKNVNLSDKISQSVVSINADTSVVNPQKQFIVNFEVLDYKIFDSLKFALIKYINSDSVLSKKYNFIKKQKELKIELLNKEIEKIDLIQKNSFLNTQSKNSPNIVVLGSSSYSLEIINLVEKKQQLEQELYNFKTLNLIKDFSKNYNIQPVSKRNYILYTAIFLIISLFIGIYRNYNNHLK